MSGETSQCQPPRIGKWGQVGLEDRGQTGPLATLRYGNSHFCLDRTRRTNMRHVTGVYAGCFLGWSCFLDAGGQRAFLIWWLSCGFYTSPGEYLHVNALHGIGAQLARDIGGPCFGPEVVDISGNAHTSPSSASCAASGGSFAARPCRGSCVCILRKGQPVLRSMK